MTALIQDTLHSRTLDSVPFLNARAVRSLADGLGHMTASERGRVDTDLMMLISIVFLHERFVQGRAH